MSGLSWQAVAELTRRLKKQNRKKIDVTDAAGSVIGVILGVLLVALIIIPLLVYGVWSFSLVTKILWSWFIVPTFGMTPLTWAQAWGLGIVVAYLTHFPATWKAKDERETKEKVSEFIGILLRPWVFLLFGWICYHYFMPS